MVVAAVIVLGAATYVIVHSDPVPNAGQVVGSSAPGNPSTVVPSTSDAPGKARIVVAFLGDDYTAGTGASAATARFSTLVCAALDLSERNFGVPHGGYAKNGAGGNYLTRVPEVVAAKPAVVVVSGGRNDVFDNLDTFTANARELFARLHSRLPTAILIAVAPFCGDSRPRTALSAVAKSIRAAVRAVGGIYFDISDPLRGHPEWMADDANPNNAGYAALATAIEPRLAAKLPGPD